MLTLRAQLLNQLKEAMKSQDKLRLETIRNLLSLVKNAEIDLKHEVSDEEFMQIVQKEVKRRKEAIEQFKSAGRQETAAEEEDKLEVFFQFMPKQLSEEELVSEMQKIKQEINATEIPQLMKEAQARLRGKADGKDVARVVQQVLRQ